MKKKVVIVDDSSVSRAALRLALTSDPDIEIVGEAEDGPTTLAAIAQRDPDIVTMDVFLRRENGLDVTRQIMASAPRPVLIVTAADTSDSGLVYRAMEAGALDVWSKPPSPKNPAYSDYCRQLARVVKALAEVPVVHRRAPAPRRETSNDSVVAPAHRKLGVLPTPEPGVVPQVVILGASTGGPPVVAELLGRLGADFRVPVVVIQHMASGFIGSFSAWLQGACGRKVNVVRSGAPLSSGEVYLPDEDRHLVFVPGAMVVATPEPSSCLHRPSIDVTFHSAAERLGKNAAAVLMTGMGKDGAQGLGALRQQGGTTIAQEPATCAIDSMPRSAIELGAASYVASPDAVPELLRRWCGLR